ncbi:MAG: T9SS type A sorting domain-containing protein [Bacteroidales bacterium]|nr:T9SS type A sorting domain-containing protein [Bacteroidales bacterium]
MKKIHLILAIVFFAVTAQAQYIYNDFDANQNETFLGWPNAPTVVANPNPSGINTSANVGQWVRTTEQWAHAYLLLDGKIDFTTGQTFSLKVWSPIACVVLFKLEDKNNGAIFVEVPQNITTPNQWVQLNFNFATASSGVYDKIVIFFDFATTTDNTFFFDDVTGPEYSGGGPSNPVVLPVTFEDPLINYGLIDFGGNFSEIVTDPTNPSNTVAKTIKTALAEPWAGTTVGGTAGFPTPIPFVPGSTLMTVDVWSPTAGTPIRLKVEAYNDPNISVETETNTTVANAWETITFDFMNEAPGTAEINFGYSYNKASIFFNFDTPGSVAGEQTYYWDNMAFAGENPEKPLMAADVQDNFENDGWGTIPSWKFQDPELVDLTIVNDPLNAANHVANYTRSGSFEWTNAQFILEHRMDLTVRNIFQIRVLFPSTNNYTGGLTQKAAIKLQNSLLGGNAWTTQTEILQDVTALDEWVTLQFDFSSVSDRTDYDQVVVQFGGEGHFVPAQFYFDDIELLNPVGISSNEISKLDISPNPANTYFRITNSDHLKTVEVFNITGQRVMNFNDVPQQISVSSLPKGIYSIKATGYDGLQYVNKVVVQ